MISILTYTPGILSKEKIKTWIKKIIKRHRGPEMVIENLTLGLNKIKFKYLINKINSNTDKIHIINSVSALEWAIKQKETGSKFELIVGPNLVLTPLDHNNILGNKFIDKILLPSEWIAEFYAELAPNIKNKIYIWPAGTDCNIKKINIKKEYCLIFKKNTEESLFQNIKKYLNENNIPFETIEYGKYRRDEYFNKLNKSKFIIYLQESESQGIALQEAWAHDVPTFVWNKGCITYNNKKFFGKVSAPFLTEQSGDFFENFDEFKNKLPKFIEKLKDFKPAEYCRNNLSIEKSAEIYVNIIEGKQKPWNINNDKQNIT